MKPTAQDFYSVFCNHKLKKVSETLRDGFSGMYVVLRILDEAESELSAGDISEIFGVTTARTAVILKTLEQKGYVSKRSGDDARITMVKITAEGRAALNTRKEKVFVEVDGFLDKLTDEEATTLYNILKKIKDE